MRASFIVGIALVLFVAAFSVAGAEYWNAVPLGAVAAACVAGYIATSRLGQRGIEAFIAFALFALPILYVWGTFAPGNHKTYLIIFLSLPAIFDSLAPPRWYWHWVGYAFACVAAAGLSGFFGYPSHWMEDFDPAVVLMLHIAFAVLWGLRYITRIEMDSYLAELAENIVKDKVTGLPSIVAFREALPAGEPVFVGLLTIGNFYELSTLFGYSLSMEVLGIAGKRLAGAQDRLGGKAFRLRGHDFGFIAPGASPEAVPGIVSALMAGISGPLVFQGKTIELSYRMGYTVVDDGDADRSLDEAEEALNLAVRGGMDVAPYSGTLKKATAAEIAIVDLMTLSRNVSEKTLGVFCQPVVSLSSGKTAWNEALVRFWERGEYLEEPARFMALAATTGHWAAIEDFMFEKSAARACGGGGPVSVNVALRDLDRPEFLAAVEAGARRAKDAGSALILEVLEGDLGAMDQRRLELLRSLRRTGCLVAIDDFGTGYSNYSRLTDMPIDIVKFDRSLVLGAFRRNAEAALVQGLARYCYNIGAFAVAEGIETEEMLEFAKKMGFDLGQGYYWSRPVPEEQAGKAELTPLLAGKRAAATRAP